MSKKDLKFIFLGTPDVASETLQILKEAGYTPCLIVTSPDKPQGRKMVVTPPPVKTWSLENNIAYIQPEKLDDEVFHKVKELGADLSIVVAYGKIMPKRFIEAPKLGSINIHYSLLPKYRGASPVESAILNGDSVTGVSIQQMQFDMDAGDVLAVKEVAIGTDETAPELRTRLIKEGGELLVKTLPDIVESKITPIRQNETEATHCRKIKKEDGEIDLNADGELNYNKYRAYFYWPRTFFFKDGKRIVITKAKLENGNFIIEKIIPEGGKEVEYKN